MKVNFEGQVTTRPEDGQGVRVQVAMTRHEIRELIPGLQALADGKVPEGNLAKALVMGAFHYVLLPDPSLVVVPKGPVQ